MECNYSWCTYHTFQTDFYCPVNEACFIKLRHPLYLTNTHDMCANIQADSHLETSSTSPNFTSSAISSTKSFDVKTTFTDKTSVIPPTPKTAGSSNEPQVTGIAIGGAIGVLLLVLLVLFSLFVRKRWTTKKKNKESDSNPPVVNRIYDENNGSLVPPMEEHCTSPFDYDYANIVTVRDGAESNETTAEQNQNKYHNLKKQYQLDSGQNYSDASEETRHNSTDIKGPTECVYENGPQLSQKQGSISGDSTKREVKDHSLLNLEITISDSVYENGLSISQLQIGQNGCCDTASREDDYIFLSQDKIIDCNDDQYYHVKNIQNIKNSYGQDDYDELAKPFKKQKNYPGEDDYDHCKKSLPGRDDDDDYDHLD